MNADQRQRIARITTDAAYHSSSAEDAKWLITGWLAEAAEVERLRKQNHDAAEERDKKHAAEAGTLASLQADMEKARNLLSEPSLGLGYSYYQSVEVAKVFARLKAAEAAAERERERADTFMARLQDLEVQIGHTTSPTEERAERAEAAYGGLIVRHTAARDQIARLKNLVKELLVPNPRIEALEGCMREAWEELRWYGHTIAGGGPMVGYTKVAREAEHRWYNKTIHMVYDKGIERTLDALLPPAPPRGEEEKP